MEEEEQDSLLMALPGPLFDRVCQMAAADGGSRQAMRGTSRALRVAADATVAELTVRSFVDGSTCWGTLLPRLPALTRLRLAPPPPPGPLVPARKHATSAACVAGPAGAALAQCTALTSLEVSLAAARYATVAIDGELVPLIYVPTALAAAPALRRLAITPDSSGSSGSGNPGGGASSSKPFGAMLHLAEGAWGAKLRVLELRGVGLGGKLPSCFLQMPLLEELAVERCSLGPDAVAGLLTTLADLRAPPAAGNREEERGVPPPPPSAPRLPRLRRLSLAGNELRELPGDGWAALEGLESLDLSRNGLVELPSNLPRALAASLVELRLAHNALATLPRALADVPLRVLDASHNWLQGLDGGRGGAPLDELLLGQPPPLGGDSGAGGGGAWAASLAELRLDNVSDKHGALVLPAAALAACSALTALSLGHNHSLCWQGVRELLARCRGGPLRRLGLGGLRDAAPAALVEALEAAPRLEVSWA